MKTIYQTICLLGWVAASVTGCFTSCTMNEKEEYHTNNVSLNLAIEQCSAGFAEVTVTSSLPAYFYLSYVEVTDQIYQETGTLWDGDELDAKIEASEIQAQLISQIEYELEQYNAWCDSLSNISEHYASFHSTRLEYLSADRFFYLLKPNTLYMAYAFVVDPSDNKPTGTVYLKSFHTRAESMFSHVRFNYRISGYWDYCYPVDPSTGLIESHVPWVGATVCLKDVDQTIFPNPGAYFDYLFKLQDNSSRILKGIYAHLNDGVGDHTSSTKFEQGETYYTAFCVLDGERNKTAFNIYKFVWEGESMEVLMTDADSEYRFW